MDKDMSKKDLKDYKTKMPLDEIQWKAIASSRGLCGVFEFAQKKYGNISSWRNRSPESKQRYMGAMTRHYFKIMAGEEIDPESGLHHLAHLLWCVATVLEFCIEDEEQKKISPNKVIFRDQK